MNKIRLDRAKAILIMPQWEDQLYFEEVQPMVVKVCVYPPGTLIFEQKYGSVAGIRWPLWAALVNGKEGL